jgi:hypothetical protein
VLEDGQTMRTVIPRMVEFGTAFPCSGRTSTIGDGVQGERRPKIESIDGQSAITWGKAVALMPIAASRGTALALAAVTPSRSSIKVCGSDGYLILAQTCSGVQIAALHPRPPRPINR